MVHPIVLALVVGGSPAAPQAESPPRAKAVGGAMATGSAALWGVTVALRLTPERRRRQSPPCDPDALCLELGYATDRVAFRGYSYGTALPAVALSGGAGYFFGAARRTPLAHPQRAKRFGLALAIVGAVAWAVPRLAFAFMPAENWDGRQLFPLMDAPFYAGLGIAQTGVTVLAYAHGASGRPPARVSFGMSPQGVSLRGAF
ncbi:MAG: hypothetical protein AAF721_36675 [Myxococcota bacterium]